MKPTTLLPLAATVLAEDPSFSASTTNSTATAIPGAYIIEFNPGHSSSSLPTTTNITTRLPLNYTLFSGISIQIHDLENAPMIAADLNTTDAIRNIWPVRGMYFPKPAPVSVVPGNASISSSRASVKRGEQPATPHQRTQVDKMHAANITGAGLTVAVVDTGIDYLHPALGGCFGPGCLVTHGWDFTGDDYWSGEDPVPDADPRETCFGHGSHVAGIIAAQENPLGFIGTAPGVKLAAYKVSGCAGYVTNELLIAGFNRAYEEGADIISCSAGFDSDWRDDPFAIAADRIVQKGVPIVVALGNSGGDGLWTAATPATGDNVVGIASVENTVQPILATGGIYSVDDASEEESFGWVNGSPEFQGNLTLEATWVSDNVTAEDMACMELPSDLDLSDKVTIIRSATALNCYSDLQLQNLVARGAKYVLVFSSDNLYNNFYGPDSLKGVAATDLMQGTALLTLLSEGKKVTLTFPNTATAGLYVSDFPNPVGAGHISTFTSWGPTFEMAVKPQFAGIGGNILSTYPLDMGGYSVLSGTSMSTPMVAGLYALLAEKLGTVDPTELRARVSSTAKPLEWYNGPELVEDLHAPVAQQGAGLVQIWDAAEVSSTVDVVSLSFGDDRTIQGTQTFTVENKGGEALVYNMTHEASVTVDSLYEKAPGFLAQSGFPSTHLDQVASVSFDPEVFQLAPGEKTQVTVSLQPPSVNRTFLPVYGGYVAIHSSDASTLRIPYLGVRGSIKDTPALVAGFNGGTYLSTTQDHFGIPASPGQVFTLPAPGTVPLSSDVAPKLIVRPVMGLRKLRMDVVPVNGTGTVNGTLGDVRRWGGSDTKQKKGGKAFFEFDGVGELPGMPVEFASRYAASQEFWGRLADGSVLGKGTYKIMIAGLRVGGDEGEQGDWDVVETDRFGIEYRE